MGLTWPLVCVLLVALLQFSIGLSLTMSSKVAILQNKGGGHGEIGYALTKQLLASGSSVTIFQDSSYKKTQQPFKCYDELTSKGAKVEEVKLSDTAAVSAALTAGKFNVIVDNNFKDVEAVKAFAAAGADKYIYISSGGMYTGDAPADGKGYAEACCKVKDDNDCRKVEVALLNDSAMKDKTTIFRPQYIYGSNTNKRGNIDYFTDRISRGIPVPMQGDGEQLVALTHVDDVASLLAAACSSKETGIFNAGTDKFISYKGLCEAIAAKLGKSSSLRYFPYSAKGVSKDLPKPSFPFRPSTFVLNPAKSKAAFNWSIKHDVAQDLEAWVAQYSQAGLDKKEFVEDEAVVALMAGP